MREYLSVFTAFAVFLLVLAVGCDSPRSWRIVVPDNHSGLIRIVFDEHGQHAPIKDGERVYSVPVGGILRVQGDSSLSQSLPLKVEFASGTPVPQEGQILAEDGRPNPNDKLFRVVGYTSDGLEFWAIIGTEDDEEMARMALHDYESDRNR